MRHQLVADGVNANASPPADVMRSRSPSSVCGGGRRVTLTTVVASGDVVVEEEKVLPNGDIYCGEFAANAPHGYGKYLWTDGCMYEGEWRKGKAAGKGMFSWPSGATFEGEFKGGRMEGYGSFFGANGETYHGSWIADRKHGCGKKSYANGDFYEGQWRRNLLEGHGRYVWRNGNQYDGEWRNGVISGRGVLILANGYRYDGQWENGVPKRSGVFTWPDCSCYIGSLSRDPKSQQQMNSEWNPAYLPVDGAFERNSAAENFPGFCIWESNGKAGDITCDIIDTIEVSMLYKSGSEYGERGEVAGQLKRRNKFCLATGEVKKPGQIILKGHKNYDLVLKLQLGIRYSVGKPSSMQPMELRPSDFDPREKFWTWFPPEGSKLTPPHHSAEFRWKDYCPRVFRHLRKLFAVDPADYIMAICGTDSLRELSSPGKSGSLFYLTQDDRFIIKTVRNCEVKVLIRMLMSYYQHVCKYENSLLTKFYGVHCVKPNGGQKVHFTVMGNLFYSEHRIHRRFDLKGSSHGRTIHKTEEEVDETTTLKDLDLNFVFKLQMPWFKILTWQIERDCEFLEAEGIMDYSLLVGLHFREDLSASKMGICAASQKVSGKDESFQDQGLLTSFSFLELGRSDTARFTDGREPLSIRLGANMPARAEHVSHGSNFEHFPIAGGGLIMPPPRGEMYQVVLYFGIIDILRDYDISKKLEHAYKSLQVDSTSISAVDPKLYSRRFRGFIAKVFVEDD